ncbi:hypothetical protein VNO77_15039 [Canavalia gladiata]|uniref:Uncharacterized protein n=1 Tax=Canavalia gladiata TaxID=3824 RepID=A0AAN9M3J8_CANGL
MSFNGPEGPHGTRLMLPVTGYRSMQNQGNCKLLQDLSPFRIHIPAPCQSQEASNLLIRLPLVFSYEPRKASPNLSITDSFSPECGRIFPIPKEL